MNRNAGLRVLVGGAHHFPHVDRFLAESWRVLKPGGRIAIVDNIAPEDPAGAEALDAFEALRDPSHGHCLGMDEWRRLITAAGFEITHEEITLKRMDFEWWTERLASAPEVIERLKAMLREAPPSAAVHFTPITLEGKLHLHQREGFLVGRKAT